MLGPKVVGKPRMEEASNLSDLRSELFKTNAGKKKKIQVSDSYSPPSPPPAPPPSLEVHDEASSCLRDETTREAAIAEKIEEEIGGMEVGEREGEESMEQNESDEDSGPDIN